MLRKNWVTEKVENFVKWKSKLQTKYIFYIDTAYIYGDETKCSLPYCAVYFLYTCGTYQA